MICGVVLLTLVGSISYLYNILLYPYIISLISIDIYNTIIISIIILVQLDNFNLFYELKNYKPDDINSNMEEKYIKIITTQLGYIIEKQNELNKINYLNNKKILRKRSTSF